jgi:D-alanyl-D-alanine dipeptidase
MKDTVIAAAAALLMTFGAIAGPISAVELNRHPLPEGFVYLDVAIADLVVELRYFTAENFVGRPVDGYVHAHGILSRPAVKALANVQADLRPFGLGLKVFDAYRPRRAVDHFVRWAGNLKDRATKPAYYPDVAKGTLFKEGYIARRSSNSRGSTVDVTIVARDGGGSVQELDMGSRYDYFGPISWPTSTAVSGQQRANRTLHRTLMIAHGFQPYAQEWWHFTLKTEPYPNTYFNFPI